MDYSHLFFHNIIRTSTIPDTFTWLNKFHSCQKWGGAYRVSRGRASSSIRFRFLLFSFLLRLLAVRLFLRGTQPASIRFVVLNVIISRIMFCPRWFVSMYFLTASKLGGVVTTFTLWRDEGVVLQYYKLLNWRYLQLFFGFAPVLVNWNCVVILPSLQHLIRLFIVLSLETPSMLRNTYYINSLPFFTHISRTT